jgi:thioredoxin 1
MLTQNHSWAEPSILVSNHTDAILLAEKINKPVLLIIISDWCAYCDKMKEDLILNTNILDDMIICYINYDKHKTIIGDYKIKSVPTMIFLKDNKEISRKIGYKDIEEFSRWLDNVK